MKTCDCCGNLYAKCFEVKIGDDTFVFDSFECAIHTLAPICSCCGCRIVGHGIEKGEELFCCAHCARQEGIGGAVDHVGK